MEKLVVRNTIDIDASSEKVWRVLTESEFTKQYMFGCEVISDWEPGKTLDWRMIHQGVEMIPVSGKIQVYEPNQRLTYTVIDPNASYPDIPDNHLDVAYSLTEENGKTTLTVEQSGFENAAEGEKRYHDVYNNGDGWNPILLQIKSIAESIKK